ncbi:sigma-70 family RNA polymerase sigma factor [Actinomadura sp. KC06]|uniref:RNA polymerase sigma factor n=1 Tax=Actinomadura sp. KC06 TaxID=2530369 RepID=UPI001043E5B5|nr:sigma-70 family RNA polymerase sigma factor [Actinomadura sp. KC06]TDD28850.1 sigma-70 family RNA polymerase sigma factor [Actinomadura sp. KC06]
MNRDQDPEESQEFTPWFKENGGHLLKAAYRCTNRNQTLAEDVAQDAAMRIFRSWDEVRIRKLVLTSPAYVHTIVVNCYRDRLKARLARTGHGEVQLTEYNEPAQLDSQLQVRAAITELPEDEGSIIFLKWYGRLTTKEAGVQLGISKDQAYRLHQRALGSLKKLLEEGEG